MSSTPCGLLRAPRAIAVILIAGGIAPGAVRSHGADFDPDYLAKPVRTLQYEGALPNIVLQTTCYNCHKTDIQQDKEALKFITFKEYARWNTDDFHRNAFRALETPRAVMMEKLLGLPTKAAESVQCLSCHSGHHKLAGDAGALPQLTAPTAKLAADGVSCQACHGPAEKWVTTHQRDTKWWIKSGKEKYADGLLDVRHPMTRAQICLSCHLGSPQEGKVLTHDMYAAGHPPLQNFEVETFVAGMPYHGHRFETKVATEAEPAGVDKLKLADLYHDWYKPGDFYRTRSVLTSSLVALRMQIQLVLDEARWTSANPAANVAQDQRRPSWPELSFYDCASCHHELDADRRRQKHPAFAAPGRPLVRRWPTVLYEVAARGLAADVGDTRAKLLSSLDAHFSAVPFGRPETAAGLAKKVADDLDKQIDALNGRTIDRAAALDYLKAVVAVGGSRPLDFEEARQLWMAAQTIVAELKNAPGGTPAEQAVVDPIEAALKPWSNPLETTLPKRLAPQDPENPTAGPYDTGLFAAGAKALTAAVEYDELAFQARMKKLADEMSSKPPEAN